MDAPCLLICPGFHRTEITQRLVQGLKTLPALSKLSLLSYPAEAVPGAVLSGYGVREFLLTQLDWPTQNISQMPVQPVFFLAFSAGCLGAIAAAHHWHYLGGTVGAFFAVDGWGVPLAAPFPVHRISHDRFTHDTSALLGSDHIDFYADPAVPHLTLWDQFSQIPGKGVNSAASPQLASLNAGQFLQIWIEKALVGAEKEPS